MENKLRYNIQELLNVKLFRFRQSAIFPLFVGFILSLSFAVNAFANYPGKRLGENKNTNLQSNVTQQDVKNVKGQLKDQEGKPIPGVTIVLKGTTQGTTTDIDGNYSFKNVPGDATLVFSFIGYESQTINISSKTTINIELKPDIQNVDEVVVTGVFDKRTRMESSVSISAINSKQMDRLALSSAGDLLKNVPGVFVNTTLGEIRNTVYSRVPMFVI